MAARSSENQTVKILYQDKRILVAVKPPGVLSVDEPGGMPDLLRQALGDPNACVRTVHRLDQAAGGVMLFARSRMAASILSAQLREHKLRKQYLAAIHGRPEAATGTLRDLLLRDTYSGTTRVVAEPGKDVQLAQLRYTVLSTVAGQSLVCITLDTGRTHQIRVQFSSRGLPLIGDRRYGRDDACPLGLWSRQLGFYHPETGQPMTFSQDPPDAPPWNRFSLV